MCKNIDIVYDKDRYPHIRDPRDASLGATLSQDDGTWRRSGYFMRWKQSSTGDEGDGMVEFIIFSPSQSLQRNIDRLVTRSGWEQTLVDPFGLLIIVLDDLFQQVDTAINKVLVVFRLMENVSASGLVKVDDKADVFRMYYSRLSESDRILCLTLSVFTTWRSTSSILKKAQMRHT